MRLRCDKQRTDMRVPLSDTEQAASMHMQACIVHPPLCAAAGGCLALRGREQQRACKGIHETRAAQTRATRHLAMRRACMRTHKTPCSLGLAAHESSTVQRVHAAFLGAIAPVQVGWGSVRRKRRPRSDCLGLRRAPTPRFTLAGLDQIAVPKPVTSAASWMKKCCYPRVHGIAGEARCTA